MTPAARRRSAAAVTPSILRDAMATWAPLCPRARAIASPMPRLPPVTSATLSLTWIQGFMGETAMLAQLSRLAQQVGWVGSREPESLRRAIGDVVAVSGRTDVRLEAR